MTRAKVYARNLTANWVGYGANLLVMFFMSPFVVHTLGDVNYGVWSPASQGRADIGRICPPEGLLRAHLWK